MKRWAKVAIGVVAVVAVGYVVATRFNINPWHEVGDKLDEFNGVAVFYNGAINNVSGRELAKDGYNLGLRYQCVEFVKRYYYERFNHRMPNAMGHAKDFFSDKIPNGQLNPDRSLLQYRNGEGAAPQVEDLIVFAPWVLNRYGHVAIVSAVSDDSMEVIQQNPGPFGSSRERFPITQRDGFAFVGDGNVVGWLRLDPSPEAVDARRTSEP